MTHPGTQRPSAWNLPAFGMLTVFLIALAALVVPQIKARKAEAAVKPVIVAVSERDATARCPRYLTAMLGAAGTVRFDQHGNAADRTELTAPICNGGAYAATPQGRLDLNCVITTGTCSDEALRAVVAINVIAHEAIHLRGELNEAAAECGAIAALPQAAVALGLTPEHGRVFAWVHYQGMNPHTPPQYRITPGNCEAARQLMLQPPALPAPVRDALTMRIAQTWAEMAG